MKFRQGLAMLGAVGMLASLQVTGVLGASPGDGSPCPAPAGAAIAWGAYFDGQLGDGAPGVASTGLVIQTAPVEAQLVGGPVVAVAAGGFHSLAIRADGVVMAWGRNQLGQLGDGTTTKRTTPVPVKGIGGIVAIAAGDAHSLALRSDGAVLGWGANANGQLGDGNRANTQTTPVQVKGLGSGVTAVSAGGSFSLALKKDGSVWSWGSNTFGQLGTGGNPNDSLSPAPVAFAGPGSGIVAISAGGAHVLALKKDGSVLSWGQNFRGQLGDGSLMDATRPVNVVSLGPASGVVSVAAGAGPHSLAVKADGTVLSWGSNQRGQLGDPSQITSRAVPGPVVGLGAGSNVVSVAAGGLHSLAVKADGAVFGWGENGSGQSSGSPAGGVAGISTLPIAMRVFGLDSGSGTVAIAAGSLHNLAIRLPTPGASANLAACSGAPQETSVGTVFPRRFAARVLDSGGNPVDQVQVTFTGPASGSGGTFPGGTLSSQVITDAGGVAIAPEFRANLTTGDYRVLAQVSGVSSQAAFSLTNTAGGGAVSLNPASLDFGRIRIGATSAGRTVGISNSGSGVVHLGRIIVSGDFLESNDCPPVLEVSQSCSISVRFDPNASGDRNGSVSLEHDAVGPSSVPLRGTGTTPGGKIEPDYFGFGGQKIGTSSSPKVFTVSNPDGEPLEIQSVAIDPGWTASSKCGSSLEGGATCDIEVVFRPKGYRQPEGSLRVSTAAGELSARLSGYGTEPEVSFSTQGLSFSPQPVGTSSNNQKATMTNTGSAVLEISGVSTPPDFSQTNNCPPSLPRQASCVFQIVFSPRDPGTRRGDLVVADDAQGSPHKLTLVGSATTGNTSFSGSLTTIGANDQGQLGYGAAGGELHTPAPIDGLDGKVASVTAGKRATVVVDVDGVVWIWGKDYGPKPVRVPDPSDSTGFLSAVRQVSAINGSYDLAQQAFYLALKKDGSVVAWGPNQCGQLGNGTTVASATPVKVQGLSNIAEVAAGGFHSLALDTAGTVWAWGWQTEGQLGNGDYSPTIPPVCGSPVKVPVKALTPAGIHIVEISAGFTHSLARTEDGKVLYWGHSGQGNWAQPVGVRDGSALGEIPTPTFVPGLCDVVQISAGASHDVALTEEGLVFVWGRNARGETGNDISVSADYLRLALTMNPEVPVRDAADPTGFLTGVVSVSGGGYHGLAVKKDGRVFAWGANGSLSAGPAGALESDSSGAYHGQTGQASSKTAVEVKGFADKAACVSGGEFHSAILLGEPGACPGRVPLRQTVPCTPKFADVPEVPKIPDLAGLLPGTHPGGPGPGGSDGGFVPGTNSLAAQSSGALPLTGGGSAQSAGGVVAGNAGQLPAVAGAPAPELAISPASAVQSASASQIQSTTAAQQALTIVASGMLDSERSQQLETARIRRSSKRGLYQASRRTSSPPIAPVVSTLAILLVSSLLLAGNSRRPELRAAECRRGRRTSGFHTSRPSNHRRR